MNQKARVSKELNSKHQKILEGLLKLPENRECADCKSIAPRWASVNLGIFICMRCSGIHRSLGVHISKVRSATLDTWLPDQIALIQSMGNAKSNSYWESELPPNYDRVGIESFILAKYKDKRWIPRGVKAIPSARVREVKQLHHREVNSNISGNEHRNNIPKSSDDKEDFQSHNTDTKLPSSNSRELVAQTISKPEHQKSESQVLEKKLEDIKTNSIAPNATDHFTLLPNHNSGVCGPKSLDAHDNTKMEIQLSKKEENVVSKELESKTPVKNGFEDLFQGLQWVAQPVPHESPKQVQNEKINNHSEKPSESPQLPTHHSQLATQCQQESSAKTNGVPQARSEIRIQHNFQNVHKPVQNQGKTGNQVNVTTAQQIGAARPSYFVGNTATYMKSSMRSDGPASRSSIATSVRPQSASTKSLNIPTQLGGDYDFSSLVQGILYKR